MDLKELLGEAFREDLTVTEVAALLADKDLVARDSLPKSVTKDVFDKTASELASLKKELRALKEQTMSDEEKLQAEIAKTRETETHYKKELARIGAKELFIQAGLAETEYSGVLDLVITTDAEETKKNAQAMIQVIASQKEAVDKAVRKELLDKTPKPPAGAGGNPIDHLAKQIEAARESGDMAAVAALIREQQTMSS